MKFYQNDAEDDFEGADAASEDDAWETSDVTDLAGLDRIMRVREMQMSPSMPHRAFVVLADYLPACKQLKTTTIIHNNNNGCGWLAFI